MAKVLVVGGAGYVGSAVATWLSDHGHAVWVLDDLSTGHRELVLTPRFIQARVGDRATVYSLLKNEKFDAIMHFAAKSLVAESVAHPELYHENNVEQTRSLVEAMLQAGVNRLVFSSTCAIFGDPGSKKITEDTSKNPINPYGQSKLDAENIMAGLVPQGLQTVSLRYFNAAGAEEKVRVGEWHLNESHLIPRTLKAALNEDPIQIFGTDYPTPDGTCLRDFVHVSDLAAAHVKALERLLKKPAGKGSFEAYNIGSERGFSVREIISACEAVVGHSVQRVEEPRRPGDPPMLVADSALARRELEYSPKYDSLDRIIESAWRWEQKLRKGIGRAVFLDRDGTLNEDPGYLADPNLVKLLPGVGEAIARLKRAGFLLVVVTNQSGVARGLIPLENLDKVHDRMNELLRPFGAQIDYYASCIHHPDIGCECRKPKPKLIVDGASRMGVNISKSFMIGDRDTDIDAGISAGCRASIFLRTSEEQGNFHPRANFVAQTLGEAANWILGLG